MRKSIIISLLVIVIGAAFYLQSRPEAGNFTAEDNPVSVKSISHAHGLGVDISDASKVYIATHYGLLMLVNDKDLYQNGKAKDDYMGFSVHPADGNIFFSSGHPATGGNIGFQKSEDKGLTWKKISSGLEGPVDFHALTVSPANTNLVYGWFRGSIQRSLDQGTTWEKFPNNFVVVNLAADPKDENIVYSASPQGLFVSKDKAQTWNILLDTEKAGAVSTVTVNSGRLFANTEKMELVVSEDQGKNWKQLNTNFSGETPLYMSFAKTDSNVGYLLTEKNSIYKTADSGMSWNKIR